MAASRSAIICAQLANKVRPIRNTCKDISILRYAQRVPHHPAIPRPARVGKNNDYAGENEIGRRELD